MLATGHTWKSLEYSVLGILSSQLPRFCKTKHVNPCRRFSLHLTSYPALVLLLLLSESFYQFFDVMPFLRTCSPFPCSRGFAARARTIIDNGETMNVKFAWLDIIFKERERKVSFPEASRQRCGPNIHFQRAASTRARLPAVAKGG